MSLAIRVSFAEIKFKGANRAHRKFFGELLFPLKTKTEPLVNIQISFQKINRRDITRFLEDDTTASKDSFFVKDTKGNLAQLDFHKFTEKDIAINVESEFDLYYLYNFIIEPLLIIWSAEKGILYLHASGICDDKRKATIFPAWRTTGKTHAILTLIKEGYRFVGDDYCLVKDGKVYLYPKSINLFSYNLRAFPSVYKSIPLKTVLRLRITYRIKQALYWLSQFLPGPLAKVFYRLSELAEVSTNIKVTPKQLEIKTREVSNLAKVILLQKAKFQSQKMVELTREQMIQKLNNIINYELEEFYKIYKKYRYLFPEKPVSIVEGFSVNYRKAISENIKEAKLLFLGEERLKLKDLLKD